MQEVPLDLGTFLIIENEQDVFIKRTAFQKPLDQIQVLPYGIITMHKLYIIYVRLEVPSQAMETLLRIGTEYFQMLDYEIYQSWDKLVLRIMNSTIIASIGDLLRIFLLQVYMVVQILLGIHVQVFFWENIISIDLQVMCLILEVLSY